jgi:GNAT superfamily N-acetyltransferase
MTRPPRAGLRRRMHQLARAAMARLPQHWRHALYRRMIDCDPHPDTRLSLGIATSQAELEACFSLLHDAYVGSGFMKPHPSGMRVTPYHALPTTTTLYARFDGEIVGTLSIIREGVFGFPLQTVFDLTQVRECGGRIAEISALAVHPRFRKTGGTILFPLMKFMYEYCTRFFDTRHMVIAVNPNRIELYESLLFFRRLQAQVVDNYDFANGAPAIGATLDLAEAPDIFHAAYAGRRPRKDLHRYFIRMPLPHIQFPPRRYFTTNDPVMSPALLDHFFNQRTQVFAQLDLRRRHLLRAIYHEACYRDVLPPLADDAHEAEAIETALRRHRRHSLKCPGRLSGLPGLGGALDLEVIDISLNGFLARADAPLAVGTQGKARVHLGTSLVATSQATVVRVVRGDEAWFFGFRIDQPDPVWQACLDDLEAQENPVGTQRLLTSFDDPEEAWPAYDTVPA